LESEPEEEPVIENSAPWQEKKREIVMMKAPVTIE